MVAPISELRKLVRDTVLADAGVSAIITGFYDDAPKSAVSPYVTFGPATMVPFDAECITAAEHTLQVDVWSENKPRLECEGLCHDIKKLIHKQTFTITEHAIGNISATYRIFDDPDGITNHGVVTITAFIEES